MALSAVFDTNVFVAALRSRRGASFALLARLATPTPGFEIHISVPLVFEYEDVLRRHAAELGLPSTVVDDLVDYVCAIAQHQPIFFLWRPALRDPGDDMVLELAVAAGVTYVVTFNVRDFAGAERFGVRVITPPAFLRLLDAEEVR